MSRQAHLPPRCPLQRKPISRPNYDVVPPFSTKVFPQHHKSLSQSALLEDQPDWLDGLLEEDPTINSKVNSHRRSSSDSHVLLDNLSYTYPSTKEESENCGGLEVSALYGPNSPRRTKSSSFSESGFVSALSKAHAGLDYSLSPRKDEDNSNFAGKETCGDLDSTSLYGPNSPRARRSSDFLENAFASGLSESVPPYLPYMDIDVSKSGIPYTIAKGEECELAVDPNADTNTAKRHAGPRSRVRKLQYIAELEKRVNFLQAMESELTARMEDLIQRRITLSTENSKLKQKMAVLQEEKFRTEDEYYYLMKEAERLKTKLANSSSRKGGSYFHANRGTGVARSGDAWSMLDMSKLNIN
ncbi:hypothetical protein ACFE04_003396 [Oxalis oulophora]